jgi:hypothetical protein
MSSSSDDLARGAHLLVSALVIEQGLSQYNLGFVGNQDPHFRLERTITALKSMSNFPWKSSSFYFELSEFYSTDKRRFFETVEALFPQAEIYDFRLEYVQQWRAAINRIPEEDFLVLNANDDHAMVPNSELFLADLMSEISQNPKVELGLISHFVEFSGLDSRAQLRRLSGALEERRPRTFGVTETIGTVLTRGSFARTWFSIGSWEDSERIVRPDNPFGRSVSFETTQALLPRGEVFRHLDGYSHAGLFYPIPPLRNLETFEARESLTTISQWRKGVWPNSIFAYAGKGVDYYDTFAHNQRFLSEVRVGVSRLQLWWGLRIGLGQLEDIRTSPNEISRKALTLSILLFFATPSGVRNVGDLVWDPILLLLGGLLRLMSGSWPRFASSVWYFGSSRAIERSLVSSRLSKTSIAHRRAPKTGSPE